MLKFIVCNPFDVYSYYLPYSHMFRALTTLFTKVQSKQYLESQGIQIMFLFDQHVNTVFKQQIQDLNCTPLFYPNGNTEIDSLIPEYYSCFHELVKKIETTSIFDGGVIYGIQPIGYEYLLKQNVYDILVSKKIDVMSYYDDIHFFSLQNSASTEDLFNVNIENLLFRDHRVEKLKKILSMSKYFDYLQIYQNKIIHHYAPLDDIVYSMFSPEDFYLRKKKILLSGNLGPYPIRTLIADAIKNPDHRQHHPANQCYDLLKELGYRCLDIDHCKTSGMISYYNRLVEYQGAYIGYALKPLDHLLWKVFEILATGTLLFSNEHPTLKQLGLIANVHYVLLEDNQVFNVELISHYLDTDLGLSICRAGYQFIREFHSNLNNMKKFVEIIKNIKNI